MSIIGNPILFGGGGGGSTSRLILGAKNETITYNGGASGSVTLDSNGTGTITIPNGIYQFNGSVSGYSTGSITIDSNTGTIYVRPVGAIYWYGVKVVNFTNASGSEPTYNDTYFRWSLGSLDTYLDGAGYISCSVFGGGNNSNNCYLTYFDGTSVPGSSAVRAVINGTTYTKVTINFTPDTSGKTIRINGQAYGNRYIEVYEWYLGTR